MRMTEKKNTKSKGKKAQGRPKSEATLKKEAAEAKLFDLGEQMLEATPERRDELETTSGYALIRKSKAAGNTTIIGKPLDVNEEFVIGKIK